MTDGESQPPFYPPLSSFWRRHIEIVLRDGRRLDDCFLPTYQLVSAVFLHPSVPTAFALTRHSTARLIQFTKHNRCPPYATPLLFFFWSSALPNFSLPEYWVPSRGRYYSIVQDKRF